MGKDPVCGMDCDPNTSHKIDYKGQSYCFCSLGCQEEFEKDPERYVSTQTGTPGGIGGIREGGY